MGQDLSQVERGLHKADGVIVKPDPDEKEDLQLGEVSGLENALSEEKSLGNGVKKTPQRRKKKRRRERNSTSSKATIDSASDRLDTQATEPAGDSLKISKVTQEMSETSDFEEIASSALQIHKPQAELELNEFDQHGAEDTDQVLKPKSFARSAKRITKPNLGKKIRATAAVTNGHCTPEATQDTESSSTGRKVKNKQSRSRVISTSVAPEEEDEPNTGPQLPSLIASSKVNGRRSAEDPFDTRDSNSSQVSGAKHKSHTNGRDSAIRHSQENTSEENSTWDRNTSDEDLLVDESTLREPQSAQNTSLAHNGISTLKSPTYGRNQCRDQAMDLIEPHSRDVITNSFQKLQQISIYKDVAMLQTTGKRKRRLPVDEDDHEQMPESEPKQKKLRKAPLKPKTPKSSGRKSTIRKPREGSPDLDDPSQKTKEKRLRKRRVVKNEAKTKGKFSQEELDIIQNEMVKYKEMYGVSTYDVNQIIQDAPSKLTALWDDMCVALPDRSRISIVKVSRRKFHNFEVRGKWTEEEDRDLKQTYEKYPKRWKQIGQVLNRHFEDCRDRWRNYVVCGEIMRKDAWIEEEEDNLRVVVAECVQAVRELRVAELSRNPLIANDERSDIELIDWQIVSEKLGHTRSRLQCLEKWHRMSKLEDSEGDSKELKLGSKSWRVKSATKDIKQMRREDYLELLIALRNTHAGKEGKVNWSKLGDSDLKVKWTCMARKVAWKKLRASVAGNERMKFQDIVTFLLETPPANDADLDGADGGPALSLASPFRGGASSRGKCSSKKVIISPEKAISSADEDDYQHIDPKFNQLDDGDFDPDDIQDRYSSPPVDHQYHNCNRDILQEVVGEEYFDSDKTDGGNQHGDEAMADRESVDLDWPTQHKLVERRTSRLGSPISFKVTRNQKRLEHDDSSTNSDDADIDMDIPARRPKQNSRPESVDLDME